MSDQWDPSNERNDEDDGDSYGGDFDDDFAEEEDEITLPCPGCGGEIHEDSVRCPLCGDYIDWSRARQSPSTWTTIWRWTAVILVFALIFPFLINLYQLLTHPRP
jgi:hypothetical protein